MHTDAEFPLETRTHPWCPEACEPLQDSLHLSMAGAQSRPAAFLLEIS